MEDSCRHSPSGKHVGREMCQYREEEMTQMSNPAAKRPPMTEEIEHGPLAGYSSDGSEYLPFIDCLCGWSSGRCNSFAIAGEDFDDHMKEAMPR